MSAALLQSLGLPDRRQASVWGETYVVKARRDHECVLCGWTIPRGDHHWTWTLAPGAWDGDYWYTGRAHAVCLSVYRASDWCYFDDVLPEPGEFRSEILDLVEEATSRQVDFS